ncbi:hypothetical protein ACJX0J_014124, partial [Zea mays]
MFFMPNYLHNIIGVIHLFTCFCEKLFPNSTISNHIFRKIEEEKLAMKEKKIGWLQDRNRTTNMMGGKEKNIEWRRAA